MIDKKDIIKIAKHAFKKGKGVPDKKLMHPRRDWVIGVLLFAVILVGGSYFSAISFSQYRNIDMEGGEAGVSLPTYKEESIKKSIEKYHSLDIQYQALIADQPVVEIKNEATSTKPVASSTENSLSTTTVSSE